MKDQPEARAVILGEYIVRQKATVRAAAEWFGVSKSTVHKAAPDAGGAANGTIHSESNSSQNIKQQKR